jgi:RNA polymerase sigma factor (sigma-70 family)
MAPSAKGNEGSAGLMCWMESVEHGWPGTTAGLVGRMEVGVALERVYRERLEAFVRVASAIAGDRDRARDVVQDGFARALAHAGEFRGEGSLEGWVWRIVVNEARRRRVPRSSSGGVPDAPIEPRMDDVAWLRGVVATLPERQRTALFLRYYADLDYEAIAEAMGVAPGTVAATLSQARSSLRRKLEGAGDGV